MDDGGVDSQLQEDSRGERGGEKIDMREVEETAVNNKTALCMVKWTAGDKMTSWLGNE